MTRLELVSNLQSKVARLQDTELEVKQLRDTLQEYNEEFRQVRNQGKVHFLSVIFYYFFFAGCSRSYLDPVKEET